MGPPSYIRLYEKGELSKRIETALKTLESCSICPRECGVNRLEGEEGYCKTGRLCKVASFNTHFGEEAPLVGNYGSGTIFLSSCNLLCSFCQNYDISHLNDGIKLEPGQIAAMMIQLQDRGCHNINFVTPTHVVPQILEALPNAIESGLNIPLVYNSGGYDKKESIEMLDDIFDIYMPDFKFWDNKWAKLYCDAQEYREYAVSSIREMHRQVGDLIIDEDGIAERGLLIRHLVMPEKIAGTKDVMEYLADNISKNTYVNVMDQYRPCGRVHEDKSIGRRLTAIEYKKAVETAKRAGLNRLDSRERVRLVFMNNG